MPENIYRCLRCTEVYYKQQWHDISFLCNFLNAAIFQLNAQKVGVWRRAYSTCYTVSEGQELKLPSNVLSKGGGNQQMKIDSIQNKETIKNKNFPNDKDVSVDVDMSVDVNVNVNVDDVDIDKPHIDAEEKPTPSSQNAAMQEILNHFRQNNTNLLSKELRLKLRKEYGISTSRLITIVKLCREQYKRSDRILTRSHRTIIRDYIAKHIQEMNVNISILCTKLQPKINVPRTQLYHAIENEVRKLSRKYVSKELKIRIEEVTRNVKEPSDIPLQCDKLQADFNLPRWQLYYLVEKKYISNQRKLVTRNDREKIFDLVKQYINEVIQVSNENSTKDWWQSEESNDSKPSSTLNHSQIALKVANNLVNIISLSKHQIYSIAYRKLRSMDELSITEKTRISINTLLDTLPDRGETIENLAKLVQEKLSIQLPKYQIYNMIRNHKMKTERENLKKCKIKIRQLIHIGFEMKEANDSIINELTSQFPSISKEKLRDLIVIEATHTQRKKELSNKYKDVIRREIQMSNSLDHQEILQKLLHKDLLSLDGLDKNQIKWTTFRDSTNSDIETIMYSHLKLDAILSRRIIKRLIHEEILRIQRKTLITMHHKKLIKGAVEELYHTAPETFHSTTDNSTESSLSENLIYKERRKTFILQLQEMTGLSRTLVSYMMWNQVKRLKGAQ